jgi:DNA-binding CsgD family transcriptional regulator
MIVGMSTLGLARAFGPTHGWESLTPTENRVTALVADGATNAAIANQLHMSDKTVKSHLTHILTKLGITNRTELAGLHRDHT